MSAHWTAGIPPPSYGCLSEKKQHENEETDQ